MFNMTVRLDVMTQDTCFTMGVCGGSVQTENINVSVHSPLHLFKSQSEKSSYLVVVLIGAVPVV